MNRRSTNELLIVFKDVIGKFIKKELDLTALFEPRGVYHLGDLVEKCFLQKGTGLSREQKATIILSCLFSALVPTFCFDHFLAKIASSKDRKAFLSLLLHHLFGGNFSLRAFISKTVFSSYLLQQLASTAKEVTVACVWDGLSFTEKVKTLGFCYKNYEEGSFFLAQIARESTGFKEFCDYVDRGLIHRSALFDWAIAYSTISKGQFTLFYAQQKKEIQKKTLLIKAVLQKKYDVKISVAMLSKFISIFGLYDFQVPEGSSQALQNASLDQKLQMDENASCVVAGAFLNSLHAFLESPKVCVEQMKKLVLALPTSSRALERLPWLSSMLSCLSLLMLYQRGPEMAMKDYPIFVFDQSESKIFKKNSQYIKGLNKDHQVSIIHLSKKQLIMLSKKLSIEKMVVTAPNDHFGYGGARNAVFLIAPVLHAMFQKYGHLCVAKALLMPDEEIKTIFKQVVCSENALVIHMGEDDLWEPPATLISDLLFACHNRHDYFFRMGSCIGRETAYVRGCFDILSLLCGCQSIYSQFAWSEKQALTGMRAVLTKPKICLNLPFGNEEAHLQAQKNTFFDFRRNAIHFAGWRYPKEGISTSHFTGITHFLRAHNPYVFGLQLTEELLCPIDYKTTPLVWNKRKQPFSSLQDAVDYMVDDKTIKAMQKQFWKNLEEYLSGFAPELQRETTAKAFQDLLELDIEKEFLDQYPLQKAIYPLKDYVQELVQQIKEYKEFALVVVAEMKKRKNPKKAIDLAKKSVERRYQKPVESMPFAYTLYLLCGMIGAGGFQEALALWIKAQLTSKRA